MNEIKIGDVVELKSGSIHMTVIAADDTDADCCYYQMIEGVRSERPTIVVYPLSALALVEDL